MKMPYTCDGPDCSNSTWRKAPITIAENSKKYEFCCHQCAHNWRFKKKENP